VSAGAAGGASRALVALLVLAALASAALLLWAVREPIFAASFLAGLVGLGAVLLTVGRLGAQSASASGDAPLRTDTALLRAAVGSAAAAVAITGPDGEMVCANHIYSDWFGGSPHPAGLEEAGEALAAAADAARRDGSAAASLRANGLSLSAKVERAGLAGDHLVWTFARADDVDLIREARRLTEGEAGERLGDAGIMVALADAEGHLVAANRAFAARATGQAGAPLSGTPPGSSAT